MVWALSLFDFFFIGEYLPIDIEIHYLQSYNSGIFCLGHKAIDNETPPLLKLLQVDWRRGHITTIFGNKKEINSSEANNYRNHRFYSRMIQSR